MQKAELEIRNVYGDLRRSEKKAADYLLEHLKDMRDLTLSQIAEQAGVSQPTVIRMLKAAGFESFKQLKYEIIAGTAQDTENSTEYPAHDCLPEAHDQVRDVPKKMATAAIAEIENVLKSISLRDYEKAVAQIRAARRIDICGIENAAAACSDLTAKLISLGLNCRYTNDVHLQKIGVASLTDQDLAIVIAYTGSSRDAADTLRAARQQGAATIAITDFTDSTINKYADITICSIPKHRFFGNAILSGLSQILIIDILYMGLIATDYQSYTEKLKTNNLLIENV